MRPEDVSLCLREGADLIGFVVEYPHPVPWNLSVEEAQRCMAVAPAARACVVTSGAPDKVLRIARETGAGYIQLHGDETPTEAAYLVQELGKRGVKVIKAIFPGRPGLLEQQARAFCEAGVFALLFDPRTPDNAAEGGAADLAAFRKLQQAVTCPVILAGHLTPENAADLVARSGAPMIDVMSGVETAPGVKDQAKLHALLESFT